VRKTGDCKKDSFVAKPRLFIENEEIGHACFAQIASALRHLFVKNTARCTVSAARF
jgi:hypothetical protein